jgi:hypothetical protein
MVAVGERVHIHGLPVDARRRGPRIVNRWNLRHLRQAIPAHYRSRLSIGVRSGPQMVDPTAQPRVAVFRRTLHELGWKEEENLQIVYRWNAGDAQHVNVSAAELVELQPDVIICQSNASGAVAWPLVARAQQPGRIRKVAMLMIFPDARSRRRGHRIMRRRPAAR